MGQASSLSKRFETTLNAYSCPCASTTQTALHSRARVYSRAYIIDTAASAPPWHGHPAHGRARAGRPYVFSAPPCARSTQPVRLTQFSLGQRPRIPAPPTVCTLKACHKSVTTCRTLRQTVDLVATFQAATQGRTLGPGALPRAELFQPFGLPRTWLRRR